MDLGKMSWCLKQKKGIRLIEPSNNLSRSYFLMAEDSLKVMINEKNNSLRWAISSCYYSMYYSLYSILMKIGIKSEIHSCTISFMENFLRDYYSVEEVVLINKAFDLRNTIQYYAERVIDKSDSKEIFGKAAEFYNKSKEIVGSLNHDEIDDIRNKLAELIK